MRTQIMRFHRRSHIKSDGQAIIIISIMVTLLFVVGALVLDVGNMDSERAAMQAASDAAALAGAEYLPDTDAAREAALQMAQENGYVVGEHGVVEIQTIPNPDGAHPSRYLVIIKKRVVHSLAQVIGLRNSVVTTHALATRTVNLPLKITGGGRYGFTDVQNPAQFGPYARYSYGDAYSTMYLDDGTPNPQYEPGGYDYAIMIPADYESRNGTSILRVEIFDPETWNVGNAPNAGPGKIDEIRYNPPGVPRPTHVRTTTRYRLYAPDNTLIAEATYGPETTSATDQKWITPTGFQFDLNSYIESGEAAQFRLNVKTIDGSSENGYNLRAGPPTGTFDPDNGTEILAIGRLPTNFNVSGTIRIDFGIIPELEYGGKIYVRKFDTDVGAKTITYRDKLGNSWPGLLASNGTFVTDTIDLPNGYPGSVLDVEYVAGSQDTSVWEMYYEGLVAGQPGDIRLID